jgi:hypothetical protein
MLILDLAIVATANREKNYFGEKIKATVNCGLLGVKIVID